jgi:AraC family transcriptional regulator, regulatory protein of adaptative response / methylated-DNA-[protein]-cysteine methyltransferase
MLPIQAAFAQIFKASPSLPPTPDNVAVQLIETPLGTLLAGAGNAGVCLLEYVDRDDLAQRTTHLSQRFGYPVGTGSHFHLDRLQTELADYFAGRLTQFTVPLWLHGTPFQKRVWAMLQQIPYGQTIAYEELARRIDQPTAVRAVARANGANRIYLLVPCHRVIGKNGQLTGYAGGLWRKQRLLELEKQATSPCSQMQLMLEC